MGPDKLPSEEAGEQSNKYKKQGKWSKHKSCNNPDFIRENMQYLGGEVIVKLECKNCGTKVRNVYKYSHAEVRE